MHAQAIQARNTAQQGSTRPDSNRRPSRWQSLGAPRGSASLHGVRCSGLHEAALDCISDGPTAPDGLYTDEC
jgi:hypothetical protein